jgi:hypothetical protein
MYLLHIDQLHNRMQITLSGTFEERQAEKLNAEVMVRIHELTEGFHILCDLTGLKQFDRSARKHYRNFMDLCRESGVRKVVRIVPDSLNNFGLTIMSYFHYKNIPVVTCHDLEEALKHLRQNRSYQQMQKRNEFPADRNWDMIEEARFGMQGRIMRCPLGDNPEDCLLHELRKLPVKERVVWLEAKTDDEVIELYRKHIKCLARKLSESSELSA